MNRNIFLTLVFILGLSSFTKGDIAGHIHDSEDGIPGKNIPVKIYRKPTGPVDTLYTTTNENGRYLEFESNFIPEANFGDTLFVKAYDGDYTTVLKFLAGTDYNLEATLDNPDNPSKAFTVSVGAPFDLGGIKDTSGLPDPITGIYRLAKNSVQTCTTQVDTGYCSYPWDHFWRSWFNFEEQDSVAKHGDSAYISLEKVNEDTLYRTLIPFEIDTTWLAAMQAGDSTVWFPLEKIVNDQTAPNITGVTEWSDTSYAGPFDVKAHITDGAGVDSSNTFLRWYIDNDSTTAWADSIKSDTFFFNIDTILGGSETINYQIKATDNSDNQNVSYWPGPSSDDWWSFNVTPVGSSENENIEGKIKAGFRVNQHLGRNFKFSCDKYKGTEKALRIFNSVGRLVDEILSNDGKWNLDGKNIPSGFYFAILDNKTKKIVNIK